MYLNRRGYAPTLLCTSCGWIAPCSECDARLTVHRSAAQLRCHYCGAMQPLPSRCGRCGFAVRPVGQGTERVAETLATMFPQAPLVRLDRDTARDANDVDAVMDALLDGSARILVGTQMVTKGHHFPGVSLVAVINADQGLFSSDFRAAERLAQTIVQVAGRAGRGTRAGEVLIQTEYPDHPLLQSLIQGGYEGLRRQRARRARRRALAAVHPAGAGARLVAPAHAGAGLLAARARAGRLRAGRPAARAGARDDGAPRRAPPRAAADRASRTRRPARLSERAGCPRSSACRSRGACAGRSTSTRWTSSSGGFFGRLRDPVYARRSALKAELEELLAQALQKLQGDLLNAPVERAAIVVERTRDAQHGDFSCNIATAPGQGDRPQAARAGAGAIVAALPGQPVAGTRSEVAGAGSSICTWCAARTARCCASVLEQGERYGTGDVGGGTSVCVEFVSANPTGPLHVGHGRQAAYGATLANLLERHRSYECSASTTSTMPAARSTS